MTKRKAISTKARFEIFKRDRFICQYCGAHPPHAVLHVDHIVPVVEGGDNDPTNLVTACDKCNLGKGPRSLTSVPESLKDKAARVSESEAQLRGYYKVMQAARDRREGDVWRVAKTFIEHFSKDDSIRKDRLQSIRMFVEKLDVYECLDAIERAIARQPYSESACFRYFCGICWHKIKDEQA
jgi:hypothetical protein